MIGEYSKDEALRITSVTVMLEGHTYTFGVRDSNGVFLLMLEKHEFPKGFFEENGKCCPHIKDPCGEESQEIKYAAWRSIAEHNNKFHFLKTVK